MPLVGDARPFFSRSERKAIAGLACDEPAAVGRCLTHWSLRSLAPAAVEAGLVDDSSQAAVSDILRQADLRLQGLRWGKTPTWDDEAVERALQILWYDARIESLWQKREVRLAVDEKPNRQVLDRAVPKQPIRPGQIERQEFAYHRHGTINLLAALTVYNGQMWAACLDKNAGEHFRPAMRRLLHPDSGARRIPLIIANGSSHISDDTTAFFEHLSPRVHGLLTPAHASWLKQAEALLEAFDERYLLRGDWCSRARMIQPIIDSVRDYNLHFAPPFDWQWSCRKFHYWLNNTPGLIRCKT